jgi:hypothetical protein
MSSSGGCGCGGSSAAVAVKGAGGCGCGSNCGCDVSLTGEGFVRPRFFGGMLLTEDDLQAAIDYSVAKRKLTNRHVIGAGVVCGLEVRCHPCDTGKVSVSPGYAIECCGNDILVSCPEEVDIIALVRDLRLRKGIDCGEPCDDQPRQDYHLYVRYAELPTEPVAPYAPDDCATGECEFSRIREGYCFELRCDPPDDVPTLLDALEACRSADDDTDTQTLTNVLTLAANFSAAPGAPAAAATENVEAAEPSVSAAAGGGTSASEAERAFVVGAEQIRNRILRDLRAGHQTTCDEYRTVASMRFDRLTSDSKQDAVTLGQAYLRSVHACACSALHPPCQTCTDDAVALAKVRVDGCDVIEVCALERRWVLSPRALAYWFPVVERMRPMLEQACCGPLSGGEGESASGDVVPAALRELRVSGERAGAAFVGAPPELRRLLATVAGQDAAATQSEPGPRGRTASARGRTAGGRARTAPTRGASSATASQERAISALEAKIEELSKRIDDLAAAEDTTKTPSSEVNEPLAGETENTPPAAEDRKEDEQ